MSVSDLLLYASLAPYPLFFLLETDGRLPGGETLREALQAVDADAAAHGRGAPAYFMINCAIRRTSKARSPIWGRCASASAACGRTRRHAAMPNSTR